MLAGCPVETARREKYEVLRPLAVGGMGELHLVRAQDPERPDRLMVVKRLHPKLAIDPDFVQMFLDEAHIASTLRHPNVVEVYEVGQDAGQYYMTMEHLHGHDLRDAMGRVAGWNTTMRNAPMRIDQALSIARAVSAGLHYSHERTDAEGKLLGIVHRDVSPHNVFLTYDGGVKIVDFGVAKANVRLSRTRTGALKGKVSYMAPEQAKGEPLDRRSDLFCIGILLWEMTTGRRLYRRRTELETLNAVVDSRPPRPSRMVANYPRDLETLVMKTLARSRDDRWATAGELVEAIDELARRQRLVVGPPAVSALMATTFADELGAWRAAQSAGVSLGDHLVAQAALAVAHDDDDDDEEGAMPAVALGTMAGEYSARRRRLWSVVAAAVVTVGIGAVWIVSADHGASQEASGAEPSAVAPIVTAVPPTPTAVSPEHPMQPSAPPSTAAVPVPTTAAVDPTAPVPTTAVLDPTAPVPTTAARVPTAPVPTAMPPRARPPVPTTRPAPKAIASPRPSIDVAESHRPTLHAKPAVIPPAVKPHAARPPESGPGAAAVVPAAEPPPRKPDRRKSTPTLEDLDKVPP